MIKADKENGVEIQGDAETVLFECITIIVSTTKQLSNVLTMTSDDILKKLFQSANLVLTDLKKEEKDV